MDSNKRNRKPDCDAKMSGMASALPEKSVDDNLDGIVKKRTITWEELDASLNAASEHPEDTIWDIFFYLRDNYRVVGSKVARTLLFMYLKLRCRVPSLLNSCMLAVSLKVSREYDDFRLPAFLELWGYDDLLRDVDGVVSTESGDGRSLRERVELARTYYYERMSEGSADSLSVQAMLAVKVFGSVFHGRKTFSAKMVGGDGRSVFADAKMFPCDVSAIQGRLFDVSLRQTRDGRCFVTDVVLSQKSVTEEFPHNIGYVDSFDSLHGHYHVFDSLSRHFVAENPPVAVDVNSYVAFCPVIAVGERFKVAAITATLSKAEGRTAFGMCDAVVTRVDRRKKAFAYELTGSLPSADDGRIEKTGIAPLSAVAGDTSPDAFSVGKPIRLTLFLKRDHEYVKRNYVAEAVVK